MDKDMDKDYKLVKDKLLEYFKPPKKKTWVWLLHFPLNETKYWQTIWQL